MDIRDDTAVARKVPGTKDRSPMQMRRRTTAARVINSWDIVWELATADFRLRFHDSIVGYFWFLLSPALMFGIYYFVFTEVIFIGIPSYALYLILGIISYNFFQDCTFSAMYSLTAKAQIIKKIYFPRYLIIFASSMTGIFSLLVNLGIVMIVVLIVRGVPALSWLIPLPFLCLLLFSTGVAYLLATLYVRFRDLAQIWNVLVLAIFWLTPVVYSVTALPESTQIIVFLNPLARIFMMFRHYLLYDFFNFQFLIITIASSIAMFIVGFAVFQKQQHKIAEHL